MIELRQVITVFLLIVSLSGNAQDYLYGKVVDENGLALINVDVHWDTKKKTDRDKKLTKPDGTFRIKLIKDKTITLIIKYPGKKDVKILVSEAEYNEFFHINMEDIGVVSITASNFEQSVYEIPASVVILTREEIADFGYSTVQEVLENIPGLYTVDHRSMTDVSIGIRGFMSDFNRNVMIQVNGVSMMSDRENDYPLEKINIPVQAIDRIEVIRGPMSVIYGTGAFLGVINIITNASAEEESVIVSTGIGSPGIRNIFVNYAVNKEGFLISFNAMAEQREGFEESWSDLISPENYAPPFTNSITPFNPNRYSRKHQGVNLSVDYEGFFANINYATSNKGFSFISPSPQGRNDYISNTLHTEFGYAQRKNERFKFELKGRYTNSFVDHDFNTKPNSYTPGTDRTSAFRVQFNTKTRIFIDNKTNKKNVRKSLYLLSGLAYSNNFINYSIYNAPQFGLRNWYLGLKPNTSAQSYSGYAQLEMKLDNFQVIAGLRIEKLSDYEMKWSANEDEDPSLLDTITGINRNKNFMPTPRLALTYSTDKNEKKGTSHHLRAMYSQAFNHSAVVINTVDVLHALGDNVNQDDYLDPEKMNSFEIGYTFINDNLNLEAGINLFYNDISGLITRNTIDVNGEFISISKNESDIETFGSEVMGKITFPKKWKETDWKIEAALSATLQSSNRKNLDSAVSYSPEQLAKFSIRGNHTLKNGLRMSLGVSSNYVSSMASYYAGDGSGNSTIPSGFVGGVSNPYLRFATNLRLSNFSISNLTKKKDEKGNYGTMYINLKVENISNHRYRYPVDASNGWADKGLYGRGRSFLCTIGYKK
jgi:outer membrane receptor for ferrienterochelin and colicin